MGSASQTYRSDYLPEDTIYNRGGIYVIIGILLILTMQFETVPFLTGVQIMPLTSILAFVMLPFIMYPVPRTPLFNVTVLFIVFILLHSAVFLFIDIITGDSIIRLISWARQFIAVIFGISIFLILRICLLHLSDSDIVKYVIYGAIPPYLLVVVNILWGVAGQQWAGNIVIAVRTFVAPTGTYSPIRATGFALEPSHFATFIAILIVPLIFVLIQQKKYTTPTILFILFTFVAFGWTFSLTGFIILFCVLVFGLFLGPNKRIILGISLIFISLLILAYIIFPENMIVRHLKMLLAGGVNISFDDRVYSTLSPFMTSFSSLTTIGYGLGGSVSHFLEIIPPEVQKSLLRVKWEHLPNLATLIGRIMAETGVLGLVLFTLIIYVGLKNIRILIRNDNTLDNKVFYQSARLGLIGTVASLSFALGSFHLPFLWFWLAYIDSRIILYSEKKTIRGNFADSTK
jgi:hypothetical protein